VEKSSAKIRVASVIKINFPSKQSPKRRKVAQSGHPGANQAFVKVFLVSLEEKRVKVTKVGQ
jgi:hypothetical protein